MSSPFQNSRHTRSAVATTGTLRQPPGRALDLSHCRRLSYRLPGTGWHCPLCAQLCAGEWGQGHLFGAYLADFEYVKDPNAATGTLHYTIFSTLRDDSDNGHAAKYKVSILGLNAGESR